MQAREKQCILEEEEQVLNPLFSFFFGRTERRDRTARPNGPTERERLASRLISTPQKLGGRRHQFAPQQGVRDKPLAVIRLLARHTMLAMDPNALFFNAGTERVPTSSLLPFRSLPTLFLEAVDTHPEYTYILRICLY